MNSARNSVVDLFDPVSREEYDPLVILQFSKEYRDHSIAMNIVEWPLLQKHISYIEKEEGVLFFGVLENQRKLRFKLFCSCA
jgi:hypothetical protein